MTSSILRQSQRHQITHPQLPPRVVRTDASPFDGDKSYASLAYASFVQPESDNLSEEALWHGCRAASRPSTRVARHWRHTFVLRVCCLFVCVCAFFATLTLSILKKLIRKGKECRGLMNTGCWCAGTMSNVDQLVCIINAVNLTRM